MFHQSSISTKHLAFYQWMMYHPHESSPDKFSIRIPRTTKKLNQQQLFRRKPTPLYQKYWEPDTAVCISTSCNFNVEQFFDTRVPVPVLVLSIHGWQEHPLNKRENVCKSESEMMSTFGKKNMTRIDKYKRPMRPTDDSSWVLLIPLSVPSAFKVKAVAEDVAATSLNDSASCNSR